MIVYKEIDKRIRIHHRYSGLLIIHNFYLMNDWKKIYESANPFKAELAKAYLEDEHQINAVIVSKRDSSYLIGLCEVYVHQKDAVLAKFLLDNEGGLEESKEIA
ncbi:hypothetical protein ABID42_002068 [Arcicella rosea]